ncbi:MAG: hypothetical protein K8L97_00605 [Anaerolineae bacterium]|nr:hypothetical protein [Anaerolineae bacterium]
MNQKDVVLRDYQGRSIRLTGERWEHILVHPEMVEQRNRLEETLTQPDFVIETTKDQTVIAYHRLYPQTPVTRKYMLVLVKLLVDDAFIVTAFYSSRQKKGKIIWQT